MNTLVEVETGNEEVVMYVEPAEERYNQPEGGEHNSYK